MKTPENNVLLKSPEERLAMGRSLREKTSRQAHTDYQLSPNGRDAVAILKESNQGRVPELIPSATGAGCIRS